MAAFLTFQFFAPLIAGIFAFVMGLAVLLVERKNVSYRYYFCTMAAVAVWSVFVAVFHVPQVAHDIWTMLHWVAGIFIAPAYLLFLITFPSVEHVVKLPLRLLIWGGAGLMAVAVLVWPENFVQYTVVDINEIPQLVVGPYVWILELFFPLYFLPGYFFAGRKLWRAYGRERAHILTGLFGLFVATTGALITNVTLAIHFGREFIWLGPIFAAMAPASLAYMLFGLREGRSRLFPSVALGGLVLLTLGYLTVTSETIEDFIFHAVLLVGVMLLAIFLVRTSLLEAADVRKFQDLSRRLQRYNEELKQADRMKTEFLNIVSHHLRTPLTHIKWALTELAQGSYGGKLVPQQQKLTKELLANNERLVTFIESLMDTSKIETGQIVLHKEKVDLEKLLWSTVKTFEKQAKAYYRVNIEKMPSTEKIPPLFVDKDAMRKVFENLLENALIYNKPGGKIYAKTHMHNNFIEIEVTDTGIGIPAADLARVGQKFFRSPLAKRDEAEGTGLGIFISRHILRLHGGDLHVESQEGKGTTVLVKLPIVE